MKTCALILMILAGACGASVQRNESAAQCSVSLGHASPATIARTIREASDGSLDPCSGSLAQRESYVADLAAIERDPDGYVTLVFWMRLLNPYAQPVNRP